MKRSETPAGAEPGLLPARLLFVVLLLVTLAAWTARADAAAGAAPATAGTCVTATAPLTALPVLLADDDGWSVRRLFSSLNNRTTVLQFCVVMMVLGLVILMKK